MIRQAFLLGVVAIVVVGCMRDLVIGRLEVWNTSQSPIQVVGEDHRDTIPACGHLVIDSYPIRPRVEITTASGDSSIVAADTGTAAQPDTFYLVVSDDGVEYKSVTKPPDTIAPCEAA